MQIDPELLSYEEMLFVSEVIRHAF